MKAVRYTGMCVVLCAVMGCSQGDDQAQADKPLVNHENKGDMGKQLEGTAFQGYGDALDKGHNVTDTLQQGADQRQAQEPQ